jgi:hypothetical protein
VVGERMLLIVVISHSGSFLAAPCYRTAVSPGSKGKSFEEDRRRARYYRAPTRDQPCGSLH